MSNLASTSTLNAEQEQKSPESQLDIGRILLTPPIVERVLAHLNARDLCSCAQVCTLWHSMACTEKIRRRRIVWFCKVGPAEYVELNLKQYFQIPSAVQWKQEVDLQENHMEPANCIALASSQLMDKFASVFPIVDSPQPKKIRSTDWMKRRKYLNDMIKMTLKPHLPAQCPITFSVSPGVVGCNKNGLPVEVEDAPALSGFFLPKLPGVEMRHIPVTHKNKDISALVPKNIPIKCLLVFLTTRGVPLSSMLIQSCLLRTSAQMAMGGSIVNRSNSPDGSILAFCGENVEAASVVIGPQDRKLEVEAKLAQFQDSGLTQNRHCLAFMFACVGRGRHLYREPNVESSVFHRMYPGVPIAGVFGSGEIGISYLPQAPIYQKVYDIGLLKRSIRKYLHSYTTVFVLIGFKE